MRGGAEGDEPTPAIRFPSAGVERHARVAAGVPFRNGDAAVFDGTSSVALAVDQSACFAVSFQLRPAAPDRSIVQGAAGDLWVLGRPGRRQEAVRAGGSDGAAAAAKWFIIQAGTSLLFDGALTGTAIAVAGAAEPGVWTGVCVVRSRQQVSVHVNGQVVATQAAPQPAPLRDRASPGPVLVGGLEQAAGQPAADEQQPVHAGRWYVGELAAVSFYHSLDDESAARLSMPGGSLLHLPPPSLTAPRRCAVGRMQREVRVCSLRMPSEFAGSEMLGFGYSGGFPVLRKVARGSVGDWHGCQQFVGWSLIASNGGPPPGIDVMHRAFDQPGLHVLRFQRETVLQDEGGWRLAEADPDTGAGTAAAGSASAEWVQHRQHLALQISRLRATAGSVPECKVCSEKAALLCLGCLGQWYCSYGCQLRHWRSHAFGCSNAAALAV